MRLAVRTAMYTGYMAVLSTWRRTPPNRIRSGITWLETKGEDKEEDEVEVSSKRHGGCAGRGTRAARLFEAS